MNILQTITEEFHLQAAHAKNIIALLDEGNTVPFIARYRKEMTGSCDDQVLRELNDRLTYLRNLEKRKEEVSASITEQGKMTDEITTLLASAVTLTEVEDIYRPYKQKRKTRASVAIAKGLQPFAEKILEQNKSLDIKAEAEKYLSDEVTTAQEAIDGARDIIAEIVSDDAATRKKLRNYFFRHGEITSAYAKGKAEADETKIYEMYAKYSEPVGEIKGHRVLALNRGEKDEFLKVSITVDTELAKRITAANFLKDGGESSKLVREAAEDSYDRLIAPSVEREVRTQLFEDASEQAIKTFVAVAAHGEGGRFLDAPFGHGDARLLWNARAEFTGEVHAHARETFEEGVHAEERAAPEARLPRGLVGECRSGGGIGGIVVVAGDVHAIRARLDDVGIIWPRR